MTDNSLDTLVICSRDGVKDPQMNSSGLHAVIYILIMKHDAYANV